MPSSLSPAQVTKIRLLRSQGMTTRRIAQSFQISQSQVSRICTGANWPANGPITKRARNTKGDFWKWVEKTEGCWAWKRGIKKRAAGNRGGSGYGYFRVDGRMRATHRLAWELTYGSIPPGLNVLHHCDNPRCCRPDHLFLGTQADNYRDMQQKGREVKSMGDEHWTRLHPERLLRGAKHWRKRRHL